MILPSSLLVLRTFALLLLLQQLDFAFFSSLLFSPLALSVPNPAKVFRGLPSLKASSHVLFPFVQSTTPSCALCECSHETECKRCSSLSCIILALLRRLVSTEDSWTLEPPKRDTRPMTALGSRLPTAVPCTLMQPRQGQALPACVTASQGPVLASWVCDITLQGRAPRGTKHLPRVCREAWAYISHPRRLPSNSQVIAWTSANSKDRNTHKSVKKTHSVNMNNNNNSGVTGAAKTVTGILGNTVSGLSNTVGGVVGM